MKTFVSKIFSKKSSSRKESEEENEVLRKTSEEPIHVDYGTDDQTSCKIDVYIHDEKTDSYDISPTAVTRIGRDPSQADVSIPEIIVSKLHCTIYFKDDAVFIKDNDSTNGTYVNNQKITEQLLMNNDIITLGKKGVVRIVFYRQ
jgi:pSer/pThr/pTyr-binding forkhead associated (FHA) protein